MRDAFIGELTELARTDPRVFLVVGDLGYSVIEEFQAEFPDRFLNPGVDEQSTVGLAAGLAASGYSVFVYSIGNFPTLRPLEQIRNDVCYHNRDVTVVAVGGGFSYGYLGYTHHAVEDIAVMRALPSMRVLSPADPEEARAATRSIVAQGGPHYLRLGKNGEPRLHAQTPTAEQLRRGLVLHGSVEGAQVVVLATGAISGEAVRAAEDLSRDGVHVVVVSVPVLKPLQLDFENLLQSAVGIVTLEEHTLHGGLASAVLEQLALENRAVPLRPLFAQESTVGRIVGSQNWARSQNGLTAADVCVAVRELTGRSAL